MEEPSDVVVSLNGVSKDYRIWDKPSNRFYHSLFTGLDRLAPGDSLAYFRDQAESLCAIHPALKCIDLQVKRGEGMGILGRNGSGKSTLLQIICSTLRSTSGEVHIEGTIGAVLDTTAGLTPLFTGRENVKILCAAKGLALDETEARMQEVIDFAGIGEFFERPLHTYSTGMVMRLAFAANTLLKPDIFIIDEALAVGDILFQQKCFDYLRHAMAGRTRIIVSHDMPAVASVADRVVVLDHGEIVFDGETGEGIEFYRRHMLNEMFKKSTTSETAEAVAEVETSSVNTETLAKETIVGDESSWIEVDEAELAGKKEVLLRKVRCLNESGVVVSSIEPGQVLKIEAIVDVTEVPLDLIFGYMVNDRFGNQVFGDNQFSLHSKPCRVEKVGSYCFRLELVWPAVRSGSYTLTIGVGEGHNPGNHVVQSWALNVATLESINLKREIQCLFTNPLTGFEVLPLRD